jgi:hypothetical protein
MQFTENLLQFKCFIIFLLPHLYNARQKRLNVE